MHSTADSGKQRAPVSRSVFARGPVLIGGNECTPAEDGGLEIMHIQYARGKHAGGHR